MTAGPRAPSAGRAADRDARVRMRTPLALLFLSGAIALVYESLWMRSFTGLFGATAPAAAATVSAMFAGFAMGSAWFGRRAPRWSRPLRVYGLLELGSAVAALAILWVQRGYESLAPSLYAHLGDAPGALLAAKTIQVLLAVLPATFLLGGTLPVITHAVDDLLGGAGLRCGSLYAANTLGAVIGALAVPFLLLPSLGASRSYVLAAVAGLVLGSAAWWLDSRRETSRPASPRQEPSAIPPPLPAREIRALLLLAFASGLLTLGLEVIWVRMLSQVHQNSVHAFAIVLAVFLAAIAIGAALGTRIAKRCPHVWLPLERIWIAAGMLTLLAPASFVPLTGGLDYLTSTSRSAYFTELTLVCALTFVPATLCAGMVLPLLLAHSVRSGEAAAPRIGRVLAANTGGAIIGPLATTFALFPWLGMWGSVVALGLGQAAVALWIRTARCTRSSPWIAAAGPLIAALLSWHVLSLPRVYLDPEQDEQLAWIREGSHGIASAVRHGDNVRLKFDNFYTLGGSASLANARQLGHIPLLLHAAPRRVAFLGLGTGITASAALMQGVNEIVVFELLPEVAAGARTIFAEQNQHLLESPHVRLIVDDARSHLRAAAQQYDVIVGDLLVPWRRGESALYTREHFVNMGRALAPGGLFCQWLPTYQMSEAEFRIVVATFLDVFPSASLWRSDFVAAFPALGLVGHAHDLALAEESIDRRVQALRAVLVAENRYMAHAAGLWLHLVGGLSADAPWVSGTRRNTQDLPWLEMLSARVPLSGAARDPSTFMGEPLLRFLEELRAPVTRGPLAALDAERLRWRDLGGDLFRASCMDAGGEEETARTLAFATLAELPREIQESVLGAVIE